MSTGPVQPASNSGAKLDSLVDPKIETLIVTSREYAKKGPQEKKNIINGKKLREDLVAALKKGARTKPDDKQFLSLRKTIISNFNEINSNPSIHDDIKKRALQIRGDILRGLRSDVEFAPD